MSTSNKNGSPDIEPSGNQDDVRPKRATPCMLRMRDLVERTSLSRSVLERLVKAGVFPAGYRTGRQHPRWLDTEIDAWLQSRMDARNGMERLTEPVELPPWTEDACARVDSCVRGTRMLRLREVVELVGYGRTEVYRRIAEEDFPPPVPLADVRRAWPKHEIEGWIATRTAGGNGRAIRSPSPPSGR